MKYTRSLIIYVLVGLPCIAFPQKRKIDTLLRSLSSAMEDTNKAKIYDELAVRYYSKNPDSFFIYCHKGLELAEKLKWKKGIALLDGRMASMLTDTGNYGLAQKYADESLSINTELNSKTEIIRSLTNIGRIYDFQSNFVRASDYFFKAMSMAEEMKDHQEMSLIGTNLSGEFFNQGDYKKAREYGLFTLKEAEIANAPADIYKAFSLLAAVCTNLGDTLGARGYYEKAIDVCTKNGYTLTKAEAITDLARIQKDTKKTLEMLLQARVIYDELSPGSYESLDNWESLVETYIQLYQSGTPSPERAAFLQQAGASLTKMIEKCKSSNNIPSLSQALRLAATVEELKGNYRQAYEYNKRYHAIEDSIYSQESKNKIANLESQRAIDLKNKEIENKELQIGNQHKKMWLLASFIVFLAIVGGLLYRQSATRKKTNTVLIQLNSELDEANKIKAKFFGILSHDLRSPVANLINFLTLQKRRPGMLTETQIADREEKIAASANSLLETMEAMLLWSKGQMEHFKPDISAVSVKELFSSLQRFFADAAPVRFTFSCENELTVQTDKHYLQTIMQNLTANAVKALHGKPNAEITWKAWQEQDKIYLSIADNGSGIQEDQLSALYDDTATTGSKYGLGLHIIRDLARAIRCSVTLQPQAKPGAVFVISF